MSPDQRLRRGHDGVVQRPQQQEQVEGRREEAKHFCRWWVNDGSRGGGGSNVNSPKQDQLSYIVRRNVSTNYRYK